MNIIPMSLSPRAYLIEGVMRRDEAAAVIEEAKKRLTPATVYGEAGKVIVDTSYRTGSHARFPKDHPAFRRIVMLALFLSGSRPEQMEPIQVARYAPGERYKIHHDAFFQRPGFDFDSQGGQRSWSCLVYLNDVAEGGRTFFPELEIAFLPIAGNVVIWENLDEERKPHRHSYHEAQAPVSGEKWSSAIWIRERAWKPKELCTATSST